MTTKKDQNSELFDFSGVEQHDKEWMDVLHPVTRKPTGARILLYSVDSEHFQNINNQAIDRRRRGRRGNEPLSQAEIQQEGATLLAKATADWTGVADEGEVLTCNEKNARHMYLKYNWLREQVDAFMSDRQNFIKT